MEEQIKYMNYLFDKRDDAFSDLFSNLFQASVAFVALAVPLMAVLHKTGCRFYLCGVGCVCALFSIFLSGALIWYNMHRYREAIKQYAESQIRSGTFEGANEPRWIRWIRKIVFIPLTIAVLLFVVASFVPAEMEGDCHSQEMQFTTGSD